MTRTRILSLLMALSLLAAACVAGSPTPGAPSPIPTVFASDTPAPTLTPTGTGAPEVSPTAENTPSFTETAAIPQRPEEAILIQEPGPGSQVTGPVRVAGMADPTFEQNLVVRLLLDDGTEIAQVPATIQSDVGQRGPFAVEIPVDLDAPRNIFIQVFATSARDGGVTHLSSTGVIYSPAGSAEIFSREPALEQISIFQPRTGETISGGVAHVEGFALATFEQTLLIEVLDAEGTVVGAESVIVLAPDPGQPGPFSADVAYTAAGTGPGRIVVRDPSPAFGGDSHLSSVEINLQP